MLARWTREAARWWAARPSWRRSTARSSASTPGAQGCLTVEGEPGIGKTRLLAELRRRAEERGHLVLHGVASEFEAHVPFGVAADAFDAYLASLDDDATRRLAGRARAELGAIFPSLRAEPAPARPTDPATSATAPTARSAR